MKHASFGGHTFLVTSDAAGVPSDEPCLDLLQDVNRGDVFVDVGAAFGSYALPALAMGADVVAFEPSDRGREILLSNIQANTWRGRAWVLSGAAFDGGALPPELRTEVLERTYPTRKLEMTTVDREVSILVDTQQIERVDWMKIDVEGAELGVLQGSAESLRRWRPTLLIEDHDGIQPGHVVSDYPASIQSSRRIHEMLRELGYAVTVMPFDVSRKYIVARRQA